MKKSTVYILVGVGVLALVGIGIFAMRRRGQAAPGAAAPGAAPAAPASPVQAITDTVSSLADRLKPTPEAAQLKRETQQQRLENRRLRGATRQAKLIKKGKIDPRDLQTLQSIQAFAGGDSFFD